MSEQKDPTYAEWSILELMGHRRLGGFVRETTLAGAGVYRIDVYGAADKVPLFSQFYPPSSLYCLTPTTENVARRMGGGGYEPVSRYDIPALSQQGLEFDQD